jgi:hypothetical protein
MKSFPTVNMYHSPYGTIALSGDPRITGLFAPVTDKTSRAEKSRARKQALLMEALDNLAQVSFEIGFDNPMDMFRREAVNG